MQASASPEVDAVFSTEQAAESSSSSPSTASSSSPITSQASPDVQQYTLKFPTSHLSAIKTHQLQHVIQAKECSSSASPSSPSSHAHLIALTADASLRQAVDTMKSLSVFALPLIEPDHSTHHQHHSQSSSSKSKHSSIHDRIIGVVNCYHLAAPILRNKIFDELLTSGDENEWQSLNNAHLPEWDLVVRTLTAINASSSSTTTTTTSSTTRNSSSNMHSSTAAVWLKADASLTDLFALFAQGAQYCLVAAANRSSKSSSSSSSSSPSGSVTVSEVEFVSVTDLLRWVQANQDKFGEILSLTLEEAGLVASIDGMRTAKTWPSSLGDGEDDSKFACVEFRARKNAGRIMSVKENTPTISAFRMMLSGDRDAVAIVDDSGKLTATLAISDFRFVDSEQLLLLSQPVDAFVKLARAHSSSSISPLTCSVSATLKQLLQLDNDTTDTPFQHCTQDHPIWVVNKQGAPVAAVTLSDIVFALSQHQP